MNPSGKLEGSRIARDDREALLPVKIRPGLSLLSDFLPQKGNPSKVVFFLGRIPDFRFEPRLGHALAERERRLHHFAWNKQRMGAE